MSQNHHTSALHTRLWISTKKMIINEPWALEIFFSDSGTISKGSSDNESYAIIWKKCTLLI